MNIFYSELIDNNRIELSKKESHHCIHVMRMNLDDIVEVLDGKGNKYTCKIISNNTHTVLDIIKKNSYPEKKFSIHIAIAPTKSHDRIDWFVEKSIELGVDEISFIKSQRSERKRINFKRINRIAVSAMKQSEQYYLPKINDLISFDKMIESAKEKLLFIAHIDQKKEKLSKVYTPYEDICILIGPEGDFTDSEIQLAKDNKFKSVSLGETVLRTETAGVHSMSLIKVINE